MSETIESMWGAYFLTPQEHHLIGSSTEEKHSKKPYIPIAIQDGWDTNIVNYIRQKYSRFKIRGTEVIDSKNKPLSFEDTIELILSPLNLTSGETINDPKPCDNQLKIIKRPEFELRNN
jgi:hypothetical protein